MALSVGQAAPDFEIPLAGSPDKFKLSDNQGKQPVVLLFFPLAWTGICTAELCSIRDSYQEYKDLGCRVVGISVDSPFALDKFKAEQSYPFDMASDFNKDVSAAYGALYEELLGFKGVSKRSAFVVGKDGKVLYAEVNDDPKQLPDFAKVKDAVRKG